VNLEYEWIFCVFHAGFNRKICYCVRGIVWEIRPKRGRKMEKLGFIGNKT
jgi:hypothetical protein